MEKILNYDEKQILENKENFFETCINSSLFQTEKNNPSSKGNC